MRSVVIHGVLALIGLVLSYQTWTRKEEPEQRPDEVTIVDCDPSKVTAMSIETPTHLITVAPKHDGADTAYWITSQRKKEEPKVTPEEKKDEPPPFDATSAPAAPDKSKDAKGKDAKAKAKDAKDANDATDAKDAKADEAKDKDKPAEKPPRPFDADAPVTFLANTKFDDFVKSMAPLRAMRGLGEIPKDKFAQFGFDKVGTFFRMECGGRKITLDVGGRTFGAADSYVRDPQTKQSYLFGGQTLTDLQSAQYKFMQSDLSKAGAVQSDADEAVIKAKGHERRLVHRNRAVQQEAMWVDASAPDKRNELFGTWFERLDRLKAKSYLDPGQEPGSDLQVEASPPKPVVTLEYKLEGKPKDTLEIVRVDTKQGNFYYARSQATRRWVTLFDSLAKQVDDDVALVVGVEEAPTQSVPDSADAPSHAAKPAAAPAPAAAATPTPAPAAAPPAAAKPPAHP